MSNSTSVSVTETPLVEISGNTYPVKDQLKALGGKWNAEKKCWMVPSQNKTKAKELVTNAPKQTHHTKNTMSKTDRIAAAARKRGETPGKCSACGMKVKFPYTECWDCREERMMGY